MDEIKQNTTNFFVSEAAQKKISSLAQKWIKSQNNDKIFASQEFFFRIEISGGGCSGFMYKYNICHEVDPENDIIINEFNAYNHNPELNDQINSKCDNICMQNTNLYKIVIDKSSMEFLHGAELNHITNFEGEYFEIHNPNAVSKCGCGTSFSI